MNSTKILKIASASFIYLSALSLLSVSIMAFFDPQSVMDLVSVKLENTDAFSSIRGVYGGVGMSIVISLLYLARKNQQLGLSFLSMLWGFYALSRTITIFAEGALGAFGTQWLYTELLFFAIALTLLLLNKKTVRTSIPVYA